MAYTYANVVVSMSSGIQRRRIIGRDSGAADDSPSSSEVRGIYTADTGATINDAGSQVCNLLWSKNANEIVSTHGYSQNQIVVWKYPNMGKLATLTGHTLRVLYLAVSPDGQTIVTGAGARFSITASSFTTALLFM